MTFNKDCSCTGQPLDMTVWNLRVMVLVEKSIFQKRTVQYNTVNSDSGYLLSENIYIPLAIGTLAHCRKYIHLSLVQNAMN